MTDLFAPRRELKARKQTRSAELVERTNQLAERTLQLGVVTLAQNELEARVAERTAQLAKRTTELAERTLQLESFLHSVSHDLRAPLRAVAGFAQILSRTHRSALDEQGRHLLSNIVDASAYMGRLIDDLLAYSQLGHSAINLKPVSLADVLSLSVRNLSLRMMAHEVTINIAKDLPTVLGDFTLLVQMFTNLIDNAMTYHEQNLPINIGITWEKLDDAAIVSVSDDGIGIDSRHFERIFEVFQRLHTQEEFAGTGVGLATVLKAAELQDGAVWVESTVGVGSTFHVRLVLASSLGGSPGAPFESDVG